MKVVLVGLIGLVLGGCHSYPIGQVSTGPDGDKYVHTRTVIVLEPSWEVKCMGSCLERMKQE